MNSILYYLKKLNKKQLVAIARLHKMPRYSTYKKEDLAEHLGDYLYQDHVAIPFLSYLSQEELDLLSTRSCVDSFLTRRLMAGGYCFAEADGSYHFPEDFPQKIIWDEAFQQQQTKNSLIYDCLEAAGYLYGSVPYDTLLKMYEEVSGDQITPDQIRQFVEGLPEYHQHFALTHNLVVQASLLPNQLFEKIRLCQGALSYYCPDRDSIRHLSRYGFMMDEKMDKLSSYLMEDLHFKQDMTNRYLALIQASFRQGGSIKDTLDALDKHPEITGFTPELREDHHFLSLINEVFAHTRLLLLRGHTAPENQAQIIHPKKIYPNSPCPCGSGKKYKKCCARLK